MAEEIEDQAEEAPHRAPRRRKPGRCISLGLVLLLLVIAAWTWFSRERLADDFITGQLDRLGVDATYSIESIGPGQQVLTNIVVGNPERPDLTIERVEIGLEPRFPLLGVGSLKLVRPRLFGTYAEGNLSFGALDRVLFDEEGEEAFTLPDIRLELVDGRALLESDIGTAGFKVQGSGNLRSGFRGIFAAIAPELDFEGCRASGATIYGEIFVENARPGFAGPLRLGEAGCRGSQFSIGSSAVEFQAQLYPDLKGFEGKASFGGERLTLADYGLGVLDGSAQFTWARNNLTAQYNIAARSGEAPQLAFDVLELEGSLRSREGFERIEVQADIESADIRLGLGIDTALGNAAQGASSTLLGPMLAQIRSALAREARGSTFAASLTMRKTGEEVSVVAPQARLRGSSGDTLLAISRLQIALGGHGRTPVFSGNFTTGGNGLPRITGRMESGRGNDMVLRLRMEEYRAGGGSLALPDLRIAQGPGGALGFSGSVRASGAFPGGSVEGLAMPVRGNWSRRGGLSLWRECVGVLFGGLKFSNFALVKHDIEVCPPPGGAIVRSDGQGLRIAAGVPALDLAGTLGETPVRLKSGATGLAWPGQLAARDIEVELGPQDSPARFLLSEIAARIDSSIAGTFAGVEAYLPAVPLDVKEAAGNWTFAGGTLLLSDAAFQLEDREQPDRFAPLIARDARLTLEDNRITATALLREPRSDREVVLANIRHDLSSGIGHADLDVQGLLFDGQLQPDRLTPLALGVIANAHGTLTGRGRIDWTGETLTSTGRFSTESLDFAAAFGPVRGLAGTIEFTDLLNFVTAPNQRITVRSFNPGIEVDSGEMVLDIGEDYLLSIRSGRWPFIGGTLILEPSQTNLTRSEVRRYTLRLEGVDAARFVDRMELANIAATGTFDGTVPLVFDEQGGRIEGGYMRSRPPGGNVSYVGALTYEDMHPIANYAFDALKSLDFREMTIALDGSLTGEIVTRVRFHGVRQGEGASSNIVTRQLARLPLQFNLNIHAPFYRLIGTFKSIYDPAFVQDPVQLGLIDENGNPIEDPVLNPLPALRPEDLPDDESTIQPRESETAP